MRRIVLASCFVVVAACVPADEAPPLGAVAFVLGPSDAVTAGFARTTESQDGAVPWSLVFTRVLLSFKTVTIGKIGEPDRCAYRGLGQTANAVVDLTKGTLTQAFDGIERTTCPDVGFILDVPDDQTVPVGGATSDDVVELATGKPAHALVEGRAMYVHPFLQKPTTTTFSFRFSPDATASRFAGCHAGPDRGIAIVPGTRSAIPLSFAAEILFSPTVAGTASPRPDVLFGSWGSSLEPFVTMDDLDHMPLAAVGVDPRSLHLVDDFYVHSDGSKNGSTGDYVRELFRYAFFFANANPPGVCSGNPPSGSTAR